MKQKLLIFLFVTAVHFSLFSQLEATHTYGFNIGFVGAIGTHVQRFGFVVQGYYVYDFAQLNASVRIYDNLKNLGPKGEHTELNTSLGLCLGYGKTHSEKNPFISSIGNQTGYKNAISYCYNFWYNKLNTTQVTGTVAFQFDRISVIIENDLLAKPMLDRFRTGAFLIQYQDQQFQYALNCTLWTGQMGSSVRNDSLFPQRGYLNTHNGLYSNTSHGLLSAQVKYTNGCGQYLQANAGVDAEQIRNTVQNRFIHDMPFVPKKWNKAQNLYIPMIDTTGNQYLYRKNQKVRKPALFLNLHSSPDIFY